MRKIPILAVVFYYFSLRRSINFELQFLANCHLTRLSKTSIKYCSKLFFPAPHAKIRPIRALTMIFSLSLRTHLKSLDRNSWGFSLFRGFYLFCSETQIFRQRFLISPSVCSTGTALNSQSKCIFSKLLVPSIFYYDGNHVLFCLRGAECSLAPPHWALSHQYLIPYANQFFSVDRRYGA